MRCVDAARELARLTARGEPDRGREVAAALAPDGALIEMVVRGDEVLAEVTARPVGPLPLRVGGRALAVLEPGAAEPAPVPPRPAAGVTAPVTEPGAAAPPSGPGAAALLEPSAAAGTAPPVPGPAAAP